MEMAAESAVLNHHMEVRVRVRVWCVLGMVGLKLEVILTARLMFRFVVEVKEASGKGRMEIGLRM